MAFQRLKQLVGQSCGLPHTAVYALIHEGRILVNGLPAEPHKLIGADDVVTFDGQVVQQVKEKFYVIFHKPRGIECTLNPDIPDNLLTVFNPPARLYPVGRLDKESEGLLLMSNDGKLFREIAHAESQKEKEYYVEVHKPLTEDFLAQMRNGVKILDTLTDPCEVFSVPENDRAFRIILRQGMNRQIRRMSYNLGFSVHKLVRTRIMHLLLDGVAPGEWRNLTESEMKQLPGLNQ